MENRIRWVRITDDCSDHGKYHGYVDKRHLFDVKKQIISSIQLLDALTCYSFSITLDFRNRFYGLDCGVNINNRVSSLKEAKIRCEEILDRYLKMEVGNDIYGE